MNLFKHSLNIIFDWLVPVELRKIDPIGGIYGFICDWLFHIFTIAFWTIGTIIVYFLFFLPGTFLTTIILAVPIAFLSPELTGEINMTVIVTVCTLFLPQFGYELCSGTTNKYSPAYAGPFFVTIPKRTGLPRTSLCH